MSYPLANPYPSEGQGDLSKMMVAVADTNGNNAVDFDEFSDKLKFYITTAFEVLDENEVRSTLDDAKDGNILKSIS